MSLPGTEPRVSDLASLGLIAIMALINDTFLLSRVYEFPALTFDVLV